MKNIEKDINEIMDYIKDLKEENRKQKEILDILKNRSYIIWAEKGVLYSGRDGDIQVPLYKEDFESEEDYKLIKEYFEKEENKN